MNLSFCLFIVLADLATFRVKLVQSDRSFIRPLTVSSVSMAERTGHSSQLHGNDRDGHRVHYLSR